MSKLLTLGYTRPEPTTPTNRNTTWKPATTSLKVTPTQSLMDVLVQGCGFFDISPDTHCLKYQRTLLDLSLSVRFANLPAGARLEIVQRHSTGTVDSTVQLAVQVEDVGRLFCDVPSDWSLWNVLLHLESSSTATPPLNLTRRSVKPSLKSSLKNMLGVGGLVYLQPVCVVLNKEFNTIPSLQGTILKNLGMASGKYAMRLMFKETDVLIKDVSHLIEAFSYIPATTSTANNDPKSSIPPSSPNASAEAPTSAVTKAPVKAPVENVDAAPALEATEDPEDQTFDRQTQIFRFYQTVSPAQIDLPDSFFTLSSSEMKQAMELTRRRRMDEENKPLMTKAMRDQQNREREKRYPKTMIRVRFPDMVFLQGCFLSSETVSCVYDFVRENLADETCSFYLYTAPPMSKLDEKSQTLYQANLSPASVVGIGFDSDTKQTYLKQHLLDTVADVPVHPSLNEWVNTSTRSTSAESEEEESVPTASQASSSRNKEAGVSTHDDEHY